MDGPPARLSCGGREALTQALGRGPVFGRGSQRLGKKTHTMRLEGVQRDGPGVQRVKRHWGVERTFAWWLNYRRHSKDYETLTRHSEAWIQIAMIHLLLKRIA